MSKKNRALASNTQNTLEQLNGSHIITLHTRSSILPPPEELKIYEDIIPGVGKVLVDSYIKQQDHRIKKETIALNGRHGRNGLLLFWRLSLSAAE